MSPDPQPRTAGAQARFRLSPASVQHIKRIAKRSRLRQNQVVDQLVTESLTLEREVKKLGYRHVGEALAVLKAMYRRDDDSERTARRRG